MPYRKSQLIVRRVTGGNEMRTIGSVTTDDLTIYPNAIDTLAKIRIEGAGTGYIYLGLVTGGYIMIQENGTNLFGIYHSGSDVVFTGAAGTPNNNIFLSPNGSGLVKFGTHTGSGDVACNGSIAILDAAGNARKLMTTA